METLGSSVSSPLLPNIKKSVVEWAARWNLFMQIGLSTTSIYGSDGQLSGNPTTFKYGLSGQPTELPTF